jgi:hypothetical protein
MVQVDHEARQPVESPAFAEFCAEQKDLNYYFWSAELATALVRKRIIAGLKGHNKARVNELFSDIDCNAFIAPNNKQFAVKYGKHLPAFDKDLSRHLAYASKLVILRFFRAFERFATKRIAEVTAHEEQRKKFRGYLKRGGSDDSIADLARINIPTSRKIPYEQMLDAGIYAQLRNGLAHDDVSDDPSEPGDPLAIAFDSSEWKDEGLRKRCLENKTGLGQPLFPQAKANDVRDAIKRVIAGARDARKRSPQPLPLIFFYALFCFGAYRRLASSIENALPQQADPR